MEQTKVHVHAPVSLGTTFHLHTASAVHIHNVPHILIFGGQANGQKSQELYKVDLTKEKMEMSKVEVANKPPERTSHGAIVRRRITDQGPKETLIIFGGLSGKTLNFKKLNDLLEYDPETNEWTVLEPNMDKSSPTIPFGRTQHAMCYNSTNDTLIVFGGSNFQSTPMNDLWVYHFENNAWESRAPTSGLGSQYRPEPRYGHAAVVRDRVDQRLYIFGGFDGKHHLGDAAFYDFEKGLWTQITQVGSDKPSARMNHCVKIIRDDAMLMFGGEGKRFEQNAIFTDIYKFTFADKRWTCVDTSLRITERATAALTCLSEDELATIGSDAEPAKPFSLYLVGGKNVKPNDEIIRIDLPMKQVTIDYLPTEQLFTKLRAFDPEEKYDFMIHTIDGSLPCHKAIVAQCEFLHEHLSNESITVQVSSHIVLNLLQYMYGGAIEIDSSLVPTILVAKEWKMLSCVDYLYWSLSDRFSTLQAPLHPDTREKVIKILTGAAEANEQLVIDIVFHSILHIKHRSQVVTDLSTSTEPGYAQVHEKLVQYISEREETGPDLKLPSFGVFMPTVVLDYHLKKLLHNEYPELSDHTFISNDDVEFKVHKSIITLRSNYFKAMFSGAFQDETDVIPLEADSQTVQYLLEILYLGTTTLECAIEPPLIENLIKISNLCDMLSLDVIAKDIITKIQQRITPETAIPVLCLAATIDINVRIYIQRTCVRELLKVTNMQNIKEIMQQLQQELDEEDE
jgi:N-acetylneuraminic acid mutarotase